MVITYEYSYFLLISYSIVLSYFCYYDFSFITHIIILDGVLKNNTLFDYVELVVQDNHIIEQKRFSGENTVNILFYCFKFSLYMSMVYL